jgi:hypothetical protein
LNVFESSFIFNSILETFSAIAFIPLLVVEAAAAVAGGDTGRRGGAVRPEEADIAAARPLIDSGTGIDLLGVPISYK